jgi:hypothetical protein
MNYNCLPGNPLVQIDTFLVTGHSEEPISSDEEQTDWHQNGECCDLRP